MTEEKKPPPDEYSAFKELLDKIANVPKTELQEEEHQFQNRPKPQKKR